MCLRLIVACTIFSSTSCKKKSENNFGVFLVYRAGTKYSVSVFGMFEGGESMPLAGEEKTTLSDAPEPPPFEASGKVIYCSTIKPTYDKNVLYHQRNNRENIFLSSN